MFCSESLPLTYYLVLEEPDIVLVTDVRSKKSEALILKSKLSLQYEAHPSVKKQEVRLMMFYVWNFVLVVISYYVILIFVW